uniref:Putative secreted protein n=1 Tax=Anopheles darlingi TaxID=43151 RepID=A0A2M4DIY6_ANODA
MVWLALPLCGVRSTTAKRLTSWCRPNRGTNGWPSVPRWYMPRHHNTQSSCWKRQPDRSWVRSLPATCTNHRPRLTPT